MISFFSRLLDILAPRSCYVCGRRLAVSEQVMCASCNRHLPRTHFELNPYENEMAKLFWGRIPIERAAALFYYYAQSEVSHVIYALKYDYHPEVGEALGRMTAVEFGVAGFFENIDFIVPIPLTRSRRRKRGYNQSEEIAQGVSEVTGIPILKNVVRRIQFYGSQTHKNRLERVENVENAFELINSTLIVGKHVLLIDDIVTTGATVCSCAETLQRDGRVKISVLALGCTKK